MDICFCFEVEASASRWLKINTNHFVPMRVRYPPAMLQKLYFISNIFVFFIKTSDSRRSSSAFMLISIFGSQVRGREEPGSVRH